MNEIYVVHRNIPYEFGLVAGVFLTKDIAIAFALTLDCKSEEISVSRWTPADDPGSQGEVEVWAMNHGRLSTPD